MISRVIPAVAACGSLLLTGCLTEGGAIQVQDSMRRRDGSTLRFTATATDADVMALYPQAAMARGVEGVATVECTFSAQGSFNACVILHEDPPGQGFGSGAVRVMVRYRWDPEAYPEMVGQRARQRVFFRLP